MAADDDRHRIAELWRQATEGLPGMLADLQAAPGGSAEALQDALDARLAPALEALAELCDETTTTGRTCPRAVWAAAALCRLAGTVEEQLRIATDADRAMRPRPRP